MGKRIWKSLTKPWLAPLMADLLLCRIVVATCSVLGLASLAGITLLPCFFHCFTGLPCPGCGMTRAVTALLHGNWSLAITFHPFSPAYVIMGALLTASAIAPDRMRARLIDAVRMIERFTALPALIVLFTVVFGLLRMGGACSNAAVKQGRPAYRAWLGSRVAAQNEPQANR